MRLPEKDSKTYKGIVTSIQGFVAAVVLFGTGFFGAINQVPGCTDAVVNYLRDNFLLLASYFGVGSGVASVVWNLFRPSVKSY